MSYTIKNLKDVEDSAPGYGMSPEVEARFARQALECEQVGMSYERLAPSARMPFGHKHARQEEVYVVVGGGGRIKIEDEIVELGPWDAVRIGTDTMRAIEAGPDGIEILAFGGPIGGESDAEVVQGWWAKAS